MESATTSSPFDEVPSTSRKIMLETTERFRTEHFYLDENAPEWKIHGMHAPTKKKQIELTFQEHMGKMAHMVDFMKLIEFDDDLQHAADDVDVATRVHAVNDDDEQDKFDGTYVAPDEDTNIYVGVENDGTSMTDDWSSVLVKLRESLEQMTVLHDVLVVIDQEQYVELHEANQFVDPAPFAPRPQHQTVAQPRQSTDELERLHERRSFAVVTSRRLAEHAAAITGQMRISATSANTHNYLTQLALLRHDYRLYRISHLNVLTGDLAYSPQRTNTHVDLLRFHVRKLDVPETTYVQARAEHEDALVVELPVEFARTQTLVCRLESRNADGENDDEWRALCIPRFHAQSPDKKFGWQRQMAYAAHTLFCRELFQMLSKQICASPHSSTNPYQDMIVENKRTLHISLGDSIYHLVVKMIDVDIDSHPTHKFMALATPANTLAHRSSTHLTWMAQSLFIVYHRYWNADALPHNTQARVPDDARTSFTRSHTRHVHTRGALSIETPSVAVEPPAQLLVRLRGIARHTVVVERLMALIRADMRREVFDDTHLSWHWVDQDEERSLMAVSLSVRKFESLTKVRSHITVTGVSVSVLIAGELRPIVYGTSNGQIEQALTNLRLHQRIECVQSLVRQLSDRWTMLEFDVRHALKSVLSPASLYCVCVNTSTTRSITIEMALSSSWPSITIAQKSKKCENGDAMVGQRNNTFDESFQLDFARLPGVAIVDRIQHLLNALA